MIIFNETEIERLSERNANFLRDWREKRLHRKRLSQENNIRLIKHKKKSQSKNWSKWKKRK